MTTSYAFAMSDWEDGEMALVWGTYSDMDEYIGFTTNHGLNMYASHQYTMVKRGNRVEWYADGKHLCTFNLHHSYSITQTGFYQSGYHKLEVDDFTIKLL